jgi:hypothetical protein
MIKRFLLAALCLFSPAAGLAQLRVELSFEQETYLPREPLNAIVRIHNTSGQALELGKDNYWLQFSIESVDGRIVKQLKPVAVEGEFTLPSAHRAKKVVNLAEAFDLSRFGRYNVTAAVRIAAWNGETFSSAAKHFGISHGVNLWEGAFGIPSEVNGERPEIRKYQLVQANHMKALSLYVRIVDENEQEVYSLFPLGPLMGLSKPDIQVDRWSNLHVFYQNGAHTYRYHMVTPDGLLLARQTWEITESRPALKPNKEGRIVVTGGVRRVSGSDLPPPDLLSETTPPPVEEPTPVSKPADAAEPKKKKKK